MKKQLQTTCVRILSLIDTGFSVEGSRQLTHIWGFKLNLSFSLAQALPASNLLIGYTYSFSQQDAHEVKTPWNVTIWDT